MLFRLACQRYFASRTAKPLAEAWYSWKIIATTIGQWRQGQQLEILCQYVNRLPSQRHVPHEFPALGHRASQARSSLTLHSSWEGLGRKEMSWEGLDRKEINWEGLAGKRWLEKDWIG